MSQAIVAKLCDAAAVVGSGFKVFFARRPRIESGSLTVDAADESQGAENMLEQKADGDEHGGTCTARLSWTTAPGRNQDAQLIAQYLEGNTSMEVVDLSDNMLQGTGAAVIADALEQVQLQLDHRTRVPDVLRRRCHIRPDCAGGRCVLICM